MEVSTAQLKDQLSDLKQCENEPVNFIGSVQAHGCLVAFTMPDRRIQLASENVEPFLGTSHRDLVSAKLDHIFGTALANEFVTATQNLARVQSVGLNITCRVQNKDLDCYVYSSGGLFCLEFEPMTSAIEPEAEFTADQLLKDSIIQMRNADQVSALGEIVCRAVRNITGMDRVMLYRFMPGTWHGEVIAEDRVLHSHSYNGHRFPASDIPRVARDLYLRNSVRMIPDVDASISRVTPLINPKTKSQLDMSDSRMRAVSPIHLEYLKNMKVGASYSFAIVSKGELWGLIACHHLSPLFVSRANRTACELIANGFAAQAPLLEVVSSQHDRISFDLRIRQAIDAARLSGEPTKELIRNHKLLFDAFGATGVAYVSEFSCDFAGLCPTVLQLRQLSEVLKKKMAEENRRVLAIQSLALIWPDWSANAHVASGVLAVSTGDVDQGMLIVFRPENIETVLWGGDPRKQLDKKGFTGRINPRTSFEAWEETVRGHSAEWTKFEIEGAVFLSNLVIDTLSSKQRMLQELTLRRK